MRSSCTRERPEKSRPLRFVTPIRIARKSRKLEKTSSSSDLHESFETASAPFRLAAAVAEFAEILRESYWAKDGSFEDVRRVVKGVFPEFDNEQVVELIYLLGKAIEYKAQLDS